MGKVELHINQAMYVLFSVFKDPAAFEYLSAVGSSHVPSDLRKESLYVKFDPLVGGISRTTDKSVPLPSSLETTR
jgi:hypothetical protein